jgi:phosphate starvation-inducible PhoH-like protein
LSEHPRALDIQLDPADNQRLANLCGQFDEHLRQLERRLGVEINNRGASFNVIGEARSAQAACEVLKGLYRATADEVLTPQRVHLFLQDSGVDALLEPEAGEEELALRLKRGVIRARGPNQTRYLRAILTHDLTFGIGPAGTGKTYLAVASAVDALERDLVRRLVLVRPAVEAGERLGFLPGDLAQKIDPYLRPMYDALYEMLGFEKVAKLLERNVIEIAPLAYMRGRTLNDAFVILDEAQNTTLVQMKMFLTRLGHHAKSVITGDVTQIDLPSGTGSGLRQARRVLAGIGGVSVVELTSEDVVRHRIVASIVDAYRAYEERKDG